MKYTELGFKNMLFIATLVTAFLIMIIKGSKNKETNKNTLNDQLGE